MGEVLRISTGSLKEAVDLTDQLQSLIRKAKMQEGICSIFVAHTTAGLTTGEIGEGTLVLPLRSPYQQENWSLEPGNR